MSVAVGDTVRVRVPNWRKVNGEWVENPTEHEVEVTVVEAEYIEFKNWWGDGHSILSRRQIVAAPATETEEQK